MRLYTANRFTFLELLIAVIIFMLVSVIIALVFRTATISYRKGSENTDLYQSLSGPFLIIQNDLKLIVPVKDKEYVKFKPDNFSFVALGSNDDGYSELELIKYSIDQNTLTRNSVKYPGDKGNIDRNPIPFLNGLSGASFSFTYQKDDEDTGKDKKKKDDSFSKNSDKSTNSDTESKSDTGKIDQLKIPFAVGIKGEVKVKSITRDFETRLLFPIFIIEKGSQSDTTANSDTQNSNQSNST